MNKNRIAFIDLAKGLCISIVMLFHIRGITPRLLPVIARSVHGVHAPTVLFSLRLLL